MTIRKTFAIVTLTLGANAGVFAQTATSYRYGMDLDIDKVRIPRPSGHLFHEHPATDSTVIRPPIPRTSGHL